MTEPLKLPLEPRASIWDNVGNPSPEDVHAAMRGEFFCEHQVPIDECRACAADAEKGERDG